MGLLDSDPFARAAPVVVAPDPWVAVLAALDQLRAAIADAPVAPAPVVHVAAPDLAEVVQAVTSLQGPATAEEIAAALAMVLAPTRNGDPATGESLAEVAAALKKLDFRLQGIGTQAYGGGAVSLDQADRALLQALASPTNVTAVVATVTASGDTTVYTPTSGKAIRLLWVEAINDPDQATSPLIKISLGSSEKYRTFAVAHRQTFEGAANEALVVNLDGAASVAVTAHIQEFTP